jgi:ribosomal protein L15
VKKWLNLRDLDSLYNKYKDNAKHQNFFDLTSLGYDKLLGAGKINAKLTIKIGRISKKALEKIQAVGGNVIYNEYSSE